MANLKPKLMYQGNDTAANVYSVSNTVGNYSIIKSINICNTSNTANVKASIHILIDGESPSSSNKLISNANVIKDDVLYYNTSVVLPANSNIYISSGSDVLTFTISGVEYA